MNNWIARILAVLAILGLVLTAVYMTRNRIETPVAKTVRQPAQKPFEEAISGLGIVEPLDEAIAVSPYFAGRVSDVFVAEGEAVAVGQPLYALDTEPLQAQRVTAMMEVRRLQANLEKLKREPRPETLPPLRARIRSLEASLAKQQDQWKRLQSVSDPAAVSKAELTRQRFQVDEVEAQLAEARAELERLEAGAWSYDIKAAQAQLEEAQARVREINVKLRQSLVVAPKVGTVLRVNIRPGESVKPDAPGINSPEQTPMLIGDTSMLQVRVDIDEVLASKVRPGAEAVGFARGDSSIRVPLQFYRIEPYMLPKRNLTGGTAERNDVRVLQVLYTLIPEPDKPIYPGQLLEVYLERLPQGGDAEAMPEELPSPEEVLPPPSESAKQPAKAIKQQPLLGPSQGAGAKRQLNQLKEVPSARAI